MATAPRVIAPFVSAPGNHNESPPLREALPEAIQIARMAGIDLRAGPLQAALELRPLVAAVGIELQQKWKQPKLSAHQQHTAVAILYIRRVDATWRSPNGPIRVSSWCCQNAGSSRERVAPPIAEGDDLVAFHPLVAAEADVVTALFGRRRIFRTASSVSMVSTIADRTAKPFSIAAWSQHQPESTREKRSQAGPKATI
jgi:hypothetical protein